MERKIQLTEDGSYTIAIPDMRVTYHSSRGALQESNHIYINTGLLYALPNITDATINVFEMGFGTGLNALLTLQQAIRLQRKIYYYTTERYPLSIQEAKDLQQDVLLNTEGLALALHQAPWEQDVAINNYFILHKTKQSLPNLKLPQQFHVAYFDAFAPTVHPELWTEAIFAQQYLQLKDCGVLVTYSSNGAVRRAMKAAGFSVEKLQGPIGKAEIVRAIKQ